MTLLTKLFLVAASLVLSACNNAAPSAPASPPAQKAPLAEPARPAKFDSTLQPANIVWDSPEKQHAWEQRNAAEEAPLLSPELQPAPASDDSAPTQ